MTIVDSIAKLVAIASFGFIEKLMQIDYSKLDKATVEKNIDKLYEPVTEDTDLSWLPQKNRKDE